MTVFGKSAAEDLEDRLSQEASTEAAEQSALLLEENAKELESAVQLTIPSSLPRPDDSRSENAARVAEDREARQSLETLSALLAMDINASMASSCASLLLRDSLCEMNQLV